MAATSKIEWTEKTWNPVRGCSVISPGCVNCYAMRQAHRFSGKGLLGKEKAYFGLTKKTKAGPQWTGVIRTIEDALLEPLSWRKPQRVFVNSMSDLFHEDVPDEFIDKVFFTMAKARRHTFQVLTKRPERMRDYVTRFVWSTVPYITEWPLPNVWLGVSVEDQAHADERIPLLLQTPAAVRFISAEPLLGPVDIHRWLIERPENADGTFTVRPSLNWVIVGGESGPGARPCHVEWIADIVKQCRAAGVPVFCKQMGSVPYVQAARLRHWEWRDIKRPEDKRFTEAPDDALGWRVHLSDRKGGDPTEWPADLRVREFPHA